MTTYGDYLFVFSIFLDIKNSIMAKIKFVFKKVNFFLKMMIYLLPGFLLVREVRESQGKPKRVREVRESQGKVREIHLKNNYERGTRKKGQEKPSLSQGKVGEKSGKSQGKVREKWNDHPVETLITNFYIKLPQKGNFSGKQVLLYMGFIFLWNIMFVCGQAAISVPSVRMPLPSHFCFCILLMNYY